MGGLSAQRVLPGGAEREGRPDNAQPQLLLPAHDARRLGHAGGQRVVSTMLLVKDLISCFLWLIIAFGGTRIV